VKVQESMKSIVRIVNSRRIRPAVSGVKFDTAHRKKASPNIFENVNQDVLVKLFEKAGDLKAVERARSILALHQDPEGISRALMALQQDRMDKCMLITGLTRQSLKFR
uniref:Transcriptional and immune response regulator n=1 Tax=Cyprinus carpio TaxID=7962 RepID=A0A8C1GDB5_CYPCA